MEIVSPWPGGVNAAAGEDSTEETSVLTSPKNEMKLLLA